MFNKPILPAKALFLLGIAAALAASCPAFDQGASLTITLVVPSAGSQAALPGSKMVSAGTAAVRVTVGYPEGLENTVQNFTVSAGPATLRVRGVAIGENRSIRVETFDAYGNPLTEYSSAFDFTDPGVPLAAVLSPSPGSALADVAADDGLSGASAYASLRPGEARTVAIKFNSATPAGAAYQITQFCPDTDEPGWLGVYAQDYSPVAPLAAGAGWALIEPAPGATYYVAMQAALGGETARYRVEARRTFFVSRKDGSDANAGGRAAPVQTLARAHLLADDYLVDTFTVIVDRSGTFASGDLDTSVTEGSVRYLGGYDYSAATSSWTKAAGSRTIISTPAAGLVFSGPESFQIEGFNLQGASVSGTSAYVLLVSGGTFFSARDCSLLGGTLGVSTTGTSYRVLECSSGAAGAAAFIEDCVVGAGALTATASCYNYGLYLNSVTLAATVTGCDIDAGTSSGRNYLTALYAYSLRGLVLVGNRIYGGTISGYANGSASPSCTAVSLSGASFTEASCVLASNIISGGDIEGAAINRTVYGLSLIADATARVAFNTIDAGRGGTVLWAYRANAPSAGKYSSLEGNVFLSSQGGTPIVQVEGGVAAALDLLRGNVFLSASTGDLHFREYINANNVADYSAGTGAPALNGLTAYTTGNGAAAIGSFFTDYAASFTSSSYMKADKLRPVSPASWRSARPTGLPAACLVDAQGARRPAAGDWTAGAIE